MEKQNPRGETLSPALERSLNVAGLTLKELRSRGHLCKGHTPDPLTEKRHHVYFLMAIVECKTLNEVGRLARRHHTSILNGVRKHAMKALGTRYDIGLEELYREWHSLRSYDPLLAALSRTERANIKLPTYPEQALEDMQAVQAQMLEDAA
jgi:hypothetical protein